MKLKILAPTLAIFLCFSSSNAFEMPKPDMQMLKDAWGKVTDATSDVVNRVTGKGEEADKQDTPASPNQENKIFSKVWKKFSDVSNDAIKLATDSDKKSRTMIEFLTAREPKYVRLLKKAQDILAESEAREQFDKIDELTLKNKDDQEKIIKLKRDRIAAPSSSYNPLADTKERIDKKISSLEAEIEDNKVQIQHLESEIIEILKKNGLNLSSEELNYFIVSAEGSELVRLMSIANNMKKIQGVIERELLQDKNNVSLAKYYTGMYLISLETYLSAHDTA